MIEMIAGHNNLHLGLLGITLASIGLFICTFIILPQALREAKKRDGIHRLRLALPVLVCVIILTFGLALFTTLGPLFDGRLGTAAQNFSRFYYGVGIGALGFLLLIIYKYGGSPDQE